MAMVMPHTAIPPLSTLAEARRRLTPPGRRKPAALKMLAAAAVLALSTLLLAGSVILGPFWQTKETVGRYGLTITHGQPEIMPTFSSAAV